MSATVFPVPTANPDPFIIDVEGFYMLLHAHSPPACLFCSRNEELEEVATADLKFLLLPALLGALTMKQVNLARRLEQVHIARVYFVDFLKRCKEYNISKFELPKTVDNSAGTPEESANGPTTSPKGLDLFAMATQRQSKIERSVFFKVTFMLSSKCNSIVTRNFN